MNRQLRDLWPNHSAPEIATIMGLTRHRVGRRAKHLKLKRAKGWLAPKTEPTTAAWIAAATVEAKAGLVRPTDVLSDCTTRPVCYARWRAWQSVLANHPRSSVAGLGRVSGFHHTSVLHGLKRLRAGAGVGV